MFELLDPFRDGSQAFGVAGGIAAAFFVGDDRETLAQGCGQVGQDFHSNGGIASRLGANEALISKPFAVTPKGFRVIPKTLVAVSKVFFGLAKGLGGLEKPLSVISKGFSGTPKGLSGLPKPFW